MTDGLGSGVLLWVCTGSLLGAVGGPLLSWLRDKHPAVAPVLADALVTALTDFPP